MERLKDHFSILLFNFSIDKNDCVKDMVILSGLGVCVCVGLDNFSLRGQCLNETLILMAYT